MFVSVTDETCEAVIAATQAGVMLFYKQLCPHCKNMEKVLLKFSALEPDAALLHIDIEANPTAAETHNALRAPTVLIIKEGRKASSKAGLMNPRELAAWYESV